MFFAGGLKCPRKSQMEAKCPPPTRKIGDVIYEWPHTYYYTKGSTQQCKVKVDSHPG